MLVLGGAIAGQVAWTLFSGVRDTQTTPKFDLPLIQRLYYSDDTTEDRTAGKAVFHKTHGHYHHHDAISRLFDGSQPPLYVLKWKELYELVESAIDKCEDVGNSVHRIVLRNA